MSLRWIERDGVLGDMEEEEMSELIVIVAIIVMVLGAMSYGYLWSNR